MLINCKQKTSLNKKKLQRVAKATLNDALIKKWEFIHNKWELIVKCDEFRITWRFDT